MSKFREALRIDKYALDVEWEQQADKFGEYAENLAQAILDRDLAKQRMEVLEARLYKTYKEKLETKGTKATEKAISSHVILDEDYNEAQVKYHQLCFEVNVLTAARSAFDQRKKALEALTQLYLSSYFSKPTISEESRYRAQAKLRETRSEKLSDRVRERRRKTSEK